MKKLQEHINDAATILISISLIISLILALATEHYLTGAVNNLSQSSDSHHQIKRVDYRATRYVGAIDPTTLNEEGRVTDQTLYYILNKSIVFGPYDVLPHLHIPIAQTSIVIDTSDWCRQLTRDDIVARDGCVKSYYTDNLMVATYVTCNTFDDDSIRELYDGKPTVGPRDGIYITVSFYCLTEEFGLSGREYINYKNHELSDTADYHRAITAIEQSITQGMKNYYILDCDEVRRVGALGYEFNSLEIIPAAVQYELL